MADYDKEQIIKDFKDSGKAYTTFHKNRSEEAKEKGEKFPAIVTFRGWLVDERLIVEKGKSSSAEPAVSGEAEAATDPEFLEFLKAHLPLRLGTIL
ncbi:hypothetical protein P4197_27920 [Pseudomonas aeruginosa]|nr:hypothetical protein [Pseudomonas aeruginosa]MDF5924020.1 hypothetical protein [Pseudomonas aeruginosa]